MPRQLSNLVLLAALSLVASAAPAADRGADYAVTGRIAAPGDGGWDYASIDPATKQVYVTHGDIVVVADVVRSTAKAPFSGIAKGHAAVPIPNRHLLAVTSARDNTVRLFDTETGKELARVPVGNDPDAAYYDASLQRLVVVNAKGGTISLVDPVARKVTSTITLKPGLEAAAHDGDTLIVNNEDLSEIETADLRTGKAGPALVLTGCEGPTGLAFDSATGQAISACANHKAAVIDVRHHRLVGLLDIGAGPDTVLVDARRRVAFIPCGGDGTLVQIALDGGARVIRSIPTERGARTAALDPDTGAIYLPTADLAPPTVAGGKLQPKPGTFHILIVTSR